MFCECNCQCVQQCETCTWRRGGVVLVGQFRWCFIGDNLIRYRFWTASVCHHLPTETFSQCLADGGQVVVLNRLSENLKKWPRDTHTHTNRDTLTHNTHTCAHTHIHTQTAAGTVNKCGGFLLQSREQPGFRWSGCCCCCWPAGLDSHWPRKSRAVSRSSTSSAAVASILAREKSLMGSPSTIFQVLFCGRQRENKTLMKTWTWLFTVCLEMPSNKADEGLCLPRGIYRTEKLMTMFHAPPSSYQKLVDCWVRISLITSYSPHYQNLALCRYSSCLRAGWTDSPWSGWGRSRWGPLGCRRCFLQRTRP